MKIITLKTVLLGVFTICNIYLLFKVEYYNKKYKYLYQLNIQLQEKVENTTFHLLNLIGTFNIKEFDTISHPVLCYFVSELHCAPCVDSILVILNNYCSSNANIELLTLVKYSNKLNFTIFKRIHKLNKNVINVNQNNTKIFKSKTPVLFMYSPNCKQPTMLFISQKEKPELLRRYLRIISEKYFAPDKDFKSNNQSI